LTKLQKRLKDGKSCYINVLQTQEYSFYYEPSIACCALVLDWSFN
jgi:hypothetical protein